MTNAKRARVSDSFTSDPVLQGQSDNAEFHLRPSDRADVDWLLSRKDPAARNIPPLVAGILRYKVRTARRVSEERVHHIALPSKRITYIMNGGVAQKGVLTMSIRPRPGCIPIATPLGATLLGMSKYQKEPFRREEGTKTTICVLKVETVEPV